MYSFQQVFKKIQPDCASGCAPVWVFFLASQAANLPIMGLDQFGSMEQHFAQVVLNQGSTTTFTIYNLSASTIEVDVQLYFPNGTPLANQQTELAARGNRDGLLRRGAWYSDSRMGKAQLRRRVYCYRVLPTFRVGTAKASHWRSTQYPSR